MKAAAADIQRITETYDGVLGKDASALAGRGFTGAPAAADRFGSAAARRDAELLRAALADPDAKDVLLDDATKTLQAIDAQVSAGHPLTAEQQRYITDFAEHRGHGRADRAPRPGRHRRAGRGGPGRGGGRRDV